MAKTDADRPAPSQRDDYAVHLPITTRWADNDVYGHVNNVVFYSFFDTAVNSYLIRSGALDIAAGTVIGLVVETACRYYTPIAFPDPVTAGLRTARIGRSSVRYEIAVFRGEDTTAAADGHFVHVYVDGDSRKPQPLPDNLRRAVEQIRRGD